MKDWIEFIKAAPRPILSLLLPISWVIFLFCIYEGGGTMEDVPWLYTSIALAPIIEYWGERAVKRFKEK